MDQRDSTIEYYEDHAQEFVSNTFAVDMTSLYEPFTDLLKLGARILDAGCGSGRDAVFFHKSGYVVTAFDASPTMVKIASELTQLPIKLLRFDPFDFVQSFDAVWACASLLHVPRSCIDDAFRRISRALVPGGIFYSSYKDGNGEQYRSGRLFSSYDEITFTELIERHPEFSINRMGKTSDVRPAREDEYWLNCIVVKSP